MSDLVCRAALPKIYPSMSNRSHHPEKRRFFRLVVYLDVSIGDAVVHCLRRHKMTLYRATFLEDINSADKMLILCLNMSNSFAYHAGALSFGMIVPFCRLRRSFFQNFRSMYLGQVKVHYHYPFRLLRFACHWCDTTGRRP